MMMILGWSTTGSSGSGRLLGEHVQSGAGDLPRIERFHQRGRVHDGAPGGIDEEGLGPHPAKGRPAEEVVRLVVEGDVDGDVVADLQEAIQIHRLRAMLPHGRIVQVGVEGGDFQAEPPRLAGQGAADLSESHDSQGPPPDPEDGPSRRHSVTAGLGLPVEEDDPCGPKPEAEPGPGR